MDLYAGFPFWLVKNPLFNYVNELRAELRTEVAVIGSGITGALVAHELCSHGIACAVFDKRPVGSGSSAASTAQLQYEIDTPLHQLLELVPEQRAVAAYKASLQAITDIETLLRETGISGDWERKDCLYLASDQQGLAAIKREYLVRQQYGLPVSFLAARELEQQYGIRRPGALKNGAAAQMDAYSAAMDLFRYHLQEHDLGLYPYTDIVRYESGDQGFTLHTANGHKIRCRYLVIAAGYEAGPFLPRKVMDLVSTYALATAPLREEELWPGGCMIWETARPYLYLRTTRDNRIMIGGGDIPFRNEQLRDALLPRKTEALLRQFRKLFPGITVHCDMAWCGTFSTTPDGLPYIGTYPGRPGMYYALGYGGNGITFSMIAAQVIRNRILGRKDDREQLFGFDR